MVIIFLFIAGLFIGSFLNVIIDRLPRGQNIIYGRSHCEFCKKNLAWYDLIPLVSFILLNGRCRYCHKWIGWKYPIVETTTGVIFIVTYQLTSGTLFHILYNLFIASVLIVVFFTDLWDGIIPDTILLSASIVSAVYLVLFSPTILLSAVLSGLGASAIFFLLFAVTVGKGMGLGDVKLVFWLGLFLSWPKIFICIYLAFLTGAIVSLILILLRKKKFHGSTIPFGPFLVLCAYLTLFYGDFLWNVIIHII